MERVYTHTPNLFCSPKGEKFTSFLLILIFKFNLQPQNIMRWDNQDLQKQSLIFHWCSTLLKAFLCDNMICNAVMLLLKLRCLEFGIYVYLQNFFYPGFKRKMIGACVIYAFWIAFWISQGKKISLKSWHIYWSITENILFITFFTRLYSFPFQKVGVFQIIMPYQYHTTPYKTDLF